MIGKNNNNDIAIFKILLIGSSGVGKSSLLLKYIKNKFSYDYQVTTGVQFFSKNVKINEKTHIKLQIWDTVGQQAFKSIVRSFYKGVSAILLVYSIDRWQSFEQLTMWLNQIKQNANAQSLIFLVGAKLDLQQIRKVSKEQALNYCKSIDAVSFTQVSSKTGQNVKQLFQKMAKTIYKKYNSSQSFRQLIRPSVQSDVGKTQSFNIKYSMSDKSWNQKKCC